jgi:membrane-associated protein
MIRGLIDIVLHLDKHLATLTAQYGVWTYAILVAIVFCETGLVVTPFLPGDSLLFAAGAICSLGTMNILALGTMLSVAAIAGDTINYQIGKAIGPRVMKSETSKLFNKKHLERTQKFFEKHGGKTIILARFVPIVRTFAPFVAGAGAMSYPKFIVYNIVGGLTWVWAFLVAGYQFGQLETIKRNFHIVIFGIIGVSLLPAVFEFLRARREGAEAATVGK